MDKRILAAIDASLRPDNIDFPRGMEFSQRKRGRRLVVSIEIDRGSRSLETLISTLDELVSHIYSAISTVERAESV